MKYQQQEDVGLKFLQSILRQTLKKANKIGKNGIRLPIFVHNTSILELTTCKKKSSTVAKSEHVAIFTKGETI